MEMSSGVQEMSMGTVCQTATCVTLMMTVLVDLMSRTVVQVRLFIGHILRLSIYFMFYVHYSSHIPRPHPPHGEGLVHFMQFLGCSSHMTQRRASLISTVVYGEHIQAQLDISIMPWVKLNAS